MRPSRTTDTDTVAARRLAQLAADLSGARPAERPEPEHDWWADHTRPARPVQDAPARPAEDASARPTEDALARPAEEPPALPVPGRHAARRVGVGVVERCTSRLPGLGPGQLGVLALAIAAAIALAAWWAVRSRGEEITPVQAGVASPLAAVEPTGTSAAPTSAGAAASDAASVTVDVAGKVRRPGIVVLDAGARVVDAVKAAGGARPRADLSGLNLARVLVDGEQIVVGAAGAAGAAPTAAAPGAVAPTGPPATLVNLNLATEEQLETLPDVGPVTAAAIIAWREQNGGFTSVDQLVEVDGIGEKTLARLSPYVTV